MTNNTLYLPPKGDYSQFQDEKHYEEKVREWGLSTTKEVKKQFWFKDDKQKSTVKIIGYEIYGKTEEYNTVIIEFEDGNLSCIHPAYLKEMQSPSFGKVYVSSGNTEQSTPMKKEEPKISQTKEEKSETLHKKTTKKEKQEKPAKIQLPEEKVHFTAAVKQLALSWNNFNEENDEVIILENVVIHEETPIEIDLCWCSHSKTLKKLELVPGDTLDFNGKIVKKKLPKGKDVEEKFIIDAPVYYKINNPSKIKKS
ncbi:hypothetical protein MXL46_13205 [Heyndrickxia sporothermodurans]|uniref:hypothetical protein n=3 Tax=Heyndrickxia sporothermodurans TaxID=46224 RepID=UPI000B080A22|nr:hypothetical protein [Heyndrickxia sporothermodurans]MEB6550046.1 hypothetical protein [Heyndrickxia sporothermodurans]MED3650704.1 hypothetical protein [Heyndrickxia sporothermodurans]MED3655784.1 hypothetical protein [Heyndrickxia sporothermodurans]MED3698388.1 hypothetical protein [Heyndrickxia sporothermodurans]MED3780626.1 hypothetical protein [Heyndrickxia sporothermodurans]